MTTEDARAEKIKLKAAQRPTPTTTTTTTPTSDLSSRYEKKKSDTAEYYKTQQDLLKKNYDISVSELDAQKKQALEQAAISHELLKKYLPTTMRATGVANTGTADSLSLQALSNYQNNLADINIGYNSDKSSLDKEYNAGLSDLESRRRTEENTLLSEYEAKVEAASTNAYEEVAQYIDEAMTEAVGTDGKISQADYDKLQNYIDNTPDLTDTDRAGLDNMLKQYEGKIRDEDAQAEFDTEVEKTKQHEFDVKNISEKLTHQDRVSVVRNAGLSKNVDSIIHVTPGDSSWFEFRVDSEVSDKILLDALNSKYSNSSPSVGSSMVYNNTLYMYLNRGDGTSPRWVKIIKRDIDVPFLGKPDTYTTLMNRLNKQ